MKMSLSPKKIAVLMGGPGSERDVSLVSGKAVAEALRGVGCDILEVEVADRNPQIPDGVEICFNAIHGTFGEDGALQSYLEEREIAYTGAGVAASRLAFDKVLSKKEFVAATVPTPASETMDCSDGIKLPTLELPFVIKPACEGSSVGIHIVREASEVQAAMEDAASYGSNVLVEQFIEGRELTVGILDGEVLPVVEIIPPDGEWYDMATKYPWMNNSGPSSEYICPADISEEITAKVQAAALAAYHSVGIKVYARVDVLIDYDGNPYILEVNTIPGMTASSLLPMAAKAAGLEFGDLCLKIAELSLAIRR